MLFCKKCGSIMLGSVKNGRKLSVCGKCGYTSKEVPGAVKEYLVAKSGGISVVDRQVDTLPVIDVDCPKCKYKKAFYWTQQTRAADEGETKFMKCQACKHVWRDYG